MKGPNEQEIVRRDAEIVRLRSELADALHAAERQAEFTRAARMTSVTEMSAMMAHQLAQPLTAINAYATSCLRAMRSDDPDISKVAQNLERLEQQSRRATEMIRHFTHFLRRRQPTLEDVDLNVTLAGSLALLEAESRHHGIEVRLDLMPRVPAVRADRELVEQVAFNLLRNAIDALKRRDDGVRKVEIRTARAENGMVEVTVADTGPGIDEAIAKHVFEPFASEKPAHVGIGLPISRSIVEAHGGHIELKSNSGKGAVLAFALPAVNEGESGE
jgi:two-component system sensor kinase FixL